MIWFLFITILLNGYAVSSETYSHVILLFSGLSTFTWLTNIIFPAYLSINDIYDEVIKKDGGVGMDLERVNSSLDQLGCQTLDESYSVGTSILVPLISAQQLNLIFQPRYHPC